MKVYPRENLHEWGPRLSGVVSRSDAIVEAKLSGDAFEITQSLFGKLGPGEKLPFSKCRQINDRLSISAQLAFLVNRPIIDVLIQEDGTIALNDFEEMKAFPPPTKDVRFLLFIRLEQEDEWAFTDQTLHCIFLVEGGKVYEIAWLMDDHLHTIALTEFWTPYLAERTIEMFTKRLEEEIGLSRGVTPVH